MVHFCISISGSNNFQIFLDLNLKKNHSSKSELCFRARRDAREILSLKFFVNSLSGSSRSCIQSTRYRRLSMEVSRSLSPSGGNNSIVSLHLVCRTDMNQTYMDPSATVGSSSGGTEI